MLSRRKILLWFGSLTTISSFLAVGLEWDHLSVHRRMVGYWARMARSGNPNGGEDPEWPAFSLDNDVYLEISATTAAKKGPTSANCDFWDTIPFPWPHI